MTTQKLRYIGPFDEVEIAESGQMVKQNHQVEVDADLAKRLLEQPTNWEKPKKEDK